MNKNELQSVVINLVAQSYLNASKLSQIEQFLLVLADKLDSDLVHKYQREKKNVLNRAVSLAQLGFFDDLPEQNELVIQRIKELAPDIF